MMTTRRWFVILGLTMSLGACDSTSSSGGDGDASAQLACTHFRNVAADAQAGILTDAELRGKLQEVHNDARVSAEPGIAEGAERMLAAATAGDSVALEAAVQDFDAACSAAGF